MGAKDKPKIGLAGGPLDTLEITSELPSKTLDNSGKLEINPLANIAKRRRFKHMAASLSLKLVDTASPLKEKYWDTFHCSSVLQVSDKARAKFCKKRWCIVCNRIRTAELIEKYCPTLNTWPDKQFITLTLVNPKAEELGKVLSKMYSDFCEIKDSERKAGRKLVGIRKLEITYNRFEDTYHPHFHFITDSPKSNEYIIDRWLQKNPTALRKVQQAKPADLNSVMELFKYFTKLTSNSSKDKVITPQALDTIFQNITGRRAFQPFGFVAHREQKAYEKQDIIPEELLAEMDYCWMKEFSDWVNSSSGEMLIGTDLDGGAKSYTGRIQGKEAAEEDEPEPMQNYNWEIRFPESARQKAAEEFEPTPDPGPADPAEASRQIRQIPDNEIPF
jgi:hypothetical protein